MENKYSEEERYRRAEKKVKEIKGFYWHLFWYLAVNIFLTFGSSLGNLFRSGSIEIHDIHFGNFGVWFFWGIGLIAHWVKVFGSTIVFSKDWEERKIKEFMEKDNFE